MSSGFGDQYDSIQNNNLSFNKDPSKQELADTVKGASKDPDSLANITNQLLSKAQVQQMNKMGVTNDVLNKLTKAVEDATNCDQNCQNTRIQNDYREKLIFAMELLNKSLLNFEISQKNYLISKNTKPNYVNYVINNANTTIDEFKNNQTKLNTNLENLIKNMIINYSYNVDYLENTDNTMKNAKNNLGEVDSKIKKYNKIVNLDARSNFYESKDIEFLRSVKFWIYIIYYVALIIILFINNYFANFNINRSNVKGNINVPNAKYFIILILALGAPFIVKKLVILFIQYYEKFLQAINIQKFPQTYNDIIMEDN
jgi:superfamily II DNA helicase RecQ